MFRGCDVGFDHYHVVRFFSLLNEKEGTEMVQMVKRFTDDTEVYKVCLLEEDSVRHLCHKRLAEYLDQIPPAENVEQEWNNLKTCTEKAALDPLRKKRKFGRNRRLRIWNDEVEEAIAKKKGSKQIMFANKVIGSNRTS